MLDDKSMQGLADYFRNFTAFMKKEHQNCPQCCQHVTSIEQVGRCVYAKPCGCRVYQGKVPEVWQK